MKYFFISLLLFQAFTFSFSEDLDVYYKEYMERFGFKLEEYPVTEEDGHVLSIWHLQPKNPNGKVVYFQHGLGDTSWTFFQLKHKSLPFFLVKEGFDVWLGNHRGNVFSAKFNPEIKDTGLFNCTMDDFVKLDLPAMINYVKSRTGVEKIYYLGHSEGTTIFFMLAMQDPIYVENNIEGYVALGAVPNIVYSQMTAIEILDKIAAILRAVKIFDTINLSNFQRNLVAGFCKLVPGLCGTALDLASAIHPSGRMNYTDIFNFFYYYPGGISKANLLHWSQIHRSKKLVYYNPNYEEDHKSVPYNYENLKKWKVKTLIARSDDDTMSSYQDVTEFYMAVENKSLIQILELPNYSHVDVLDAESAYEEVFMSVINFLKN